MLRTGIGKVLSLVMISAVVLLIAASAVAQEPADTYKVSYFLNANNPSITDTATVRITNPGEDSAMNLCAMIYVFRYDEELQECCGCRLTSNDLRTIPLTGLTSNPSNGLKATLTSGVIKIVSAAPNTAAGFCDPTGGDTLTATPNNIVPTPTLRAWATHLQTPFTSSPTRVATTEEEFADSTLSPTELTTLQQKCFLARAVGSGRGVCGCGSGL